MEEQNTPDQYLSPIAPITTPISVGAQQRTPVLPRALNYMERRSSVPSTTPSTESSPQPATTIQGAIFDQSNEIPLVETPAMPIPPKPPHSQGANTDFNVGVTPEDTTRVLQCCERVIPHEILQERSNCHPKRKVLRQLRQHYTTQKQSEGTGIFGEAHPQDEAPTPISRPQLLNCASSSQIKAKPARPCRSLPPDTTRNVTQHSSTTRPHSDNQQSPVFTSFAAHTYTAMTRYDKTKTTHSGVLTWPSQSIECKDYQTGQKTQLSATLHPSSLCAGLEAPDPIRTQWKSMHHVHSRNASRLFPNGHHHTVDAAPEESVLMWTLLQPTLDTPWRHTYAWNEQLEGLVEAINDSDFQSTYQQFSKFFDGVTISKALWSSPTNHLKCSNLRHVDLTQKTQPPYANCIQVPLKFLEANIKRR